MHILNPILVTKASGLQENFDEAKVVRSLSSNGVSVDAANGAVLYLKQHLKPGITTQEIRDIVGDYLRAHAPTSAYFNYSLKKAVMDLGPSGHPFEVLVAEVLKRFGYHTEVGVVTLGKCVTHEIDVIARINTNQFFTECKFHNNPGVKTDIQVALYTFARFQDVKLAMETAHGINTQYYSWLITNTKATSEVFDYAKCVGLKVTSWTEPRNEGISDLIMKSGLHPITVLGHLNRRKIDELLSRGIVTCSQLGDEVTHNRVADIFGDEEMKRITRDINEICRNR